MNKENNALLSNRLL
jgi:hypothetical protein